MIKLNLTIKPDDIYPDFLNINPLDAQERAVDIGQWVDHGECEEILCEDALNFMDFNIVPNVLQNWCEKVAINGTITVGTYDIFEISKDTTNRKIYIEGQEELSVLGAANEFLYGKGRRNCLSCSYLCEIFKMFQFKILRKKINGYKVFVTAQRIQ